jgi:hypothetical protein
MRKALPALLLMALVCGLLKSAALAADNTVAIKEAASAAKAWLKLVDDGDYANSWKQASTLFQHDVSADSWARRVAGVRDPLGPLISRNLVGAQYATSLPGAPDGQYVVIRYSSSFKNKTSAVETVTPMLSKDGIWRVSGYFIK